MFVRDILMWEKKKINMGESCICPYVMENGWKLYKF
jgi:hypothetical protein